MAGVPPTREREMRSNGVGEPIDIEDCDSGAERVAEHTDAARHDGWEPERGRGCCADPGVRDAEPVRLVSDVDGGCIELRALRSRRSPPDRRKRQIATAGL